MFSDKDISRLNNLILLLGQQETRLTRAVRNLLEKEKRLLYACKEALLNHEEEKARMYACEVAGVRGAIKLVKRVELRVKSLRLRLISVVQFVMIWRDISPTIKEMDEEARHLKDKLPWLKQSIEELCGEAERLIEALQPEMNLPPGVPFVAPESVLDEVRRSVETRMETYLPSPPEDVGEISLPRPRRSEPITISLEGLDGMDEAELNQMAVEESLLDYIRRNGGRINLDRCAEDLNVSKKEVLRALRRLEEKGKIRLGG